MAINGIQKFSFVDYPGKLCCIVFFGGCNFRCPFCHNPALVFDPASQGEMPQEELLAFLKTRVGKLDGVVFSGGEPSLQPELPELAAAVKELGFCVKLDTNGTRPAVIKSLYESGKLDALGIDYKAPAALYGKLAGISNGTEAVSAVRESISYAVEKGIDLDVRTTVHRELLSEEDLGVMYRELMELGVKKWTLQQFHNVDLIDTGLGEKETYSDSELRRIAASLGPEVALRGTKSSGN